MATDFKPGEILTIAEAALIMRCSKTHMQNVIQGRVANCWRKMRVYIERKLGHSLVLISVVERHHNGRPHLHLLIGSFLEQSWISEAWDSLGGGRIVDIRRVQIKRVAAYLAKYITPLGRGLCTINPRGSCQVRTMADNSKSAGGANGNVLGSTPLCMRASGHCYRNNCLLG